MDTLFPLSAGDEVDTEYLHQSRLHEDVAPILVHYGGAEH